MKKWNTFSLAVILIVLILNNAKAQQTELLKRTLLPDYPSASGIIYHNNRLYVMGDDARNLLVLDTTHKKMDSVMLFPFSGYRLPWNEKPGIESILLATYKNQPWLLALPSFSSPVRNKIAIVSLNDISKTFISTQNNPGTRLKNKGIEEINIEGSTIVRKKAIMSNRANLSNRTNYLLIASARKNAFTKVRRWRKVSVMLPQNKNVIGISGLEYWKERDVLLFTASTEETTSANQDGEIGDSYLGMINNISRRLKEANVHVDTLINLSTGLKIGPQKMEGVCLQENGLNSAVLHLAADNDDGRSVIYKIRLNF